MLVVIERGEMIMTNFEKIKAMDESKLADVIADLVYRCTMSARCGDYCDCCPLGWCADCCDNHDVYDWLVKEVDNSRPY